MKHKLLFLAANPRGTEAIAVQEECDGIQEALHMATDRDGFEFDSRWAVDVDKLMRCLNELSPTIVHFSGHGIRSSDIPEPRNMDSMRGSGLLLHRRESSQWVSDHAFANMIACAKPPVRLVVLNACDSAAIAESLRGRVDCVIGIEGAIEDQAACSFAATFYSALGHRCSVGDAVAQARVILEAKHDPRPTVVCYTRDGLNADEIFLSRPEPSPGPEPGRYDVFLLHPHANQASASALFDLLVPDVDVFLAGRSLEAGEHWADQVLAAQCASRASVLMISAHADAAWYLSREVITAISLHRADPAAHRLVLLPFESNLRVPHCLTSAGVIDAISIAGLHGVASQLRQHVAAIRRAETEPLRAGPTGSGLANDVRGGRNHFLLYDRLSRLTDRVLEQVVSRAGVDREALARPMATVSEQALDVAQLAALDPALSRRVSMELDRRTPWTRR